MEPQIKLLSYRKRQSFFWLLLTIFLVSLPIFIFYTSGYRLSFENEETTIVTTGGIYITTGNLEVDVYLDEEQVDRPRLFRSAYYIQNIEKGSHRLVVQGEGLNTWVKELPVDSYIVTEVAAFNMPVIPQVRPIPKFRTATGVGIFIEKSTSTNLFTQGTTTEAFLVTTNTATSTLIANAEYTFVESLFAEAASSSATSTATIADRIETQIERFQFATGTVPIATTTEEFIERNNMRIVQRDDELYAKWVGSLNTVPYYFCVFDGASSTIATRYGNHVSLQIDLQRQSTTTPLWFTNNRACRSEVKLDRKWQTVEDFYFFPDATDLVIMKLEDGLYVTEIDDRAWQNTQVIYAGENFEVVVTNDAIYILEDGRYFEVLTTIEATS
jgi:hypothetical protein